MPKMIEVRTPVSSAASFEVKVDGQTAASWEELVGQFDDASIYQTWAYGAVRWGARNLSHLVLSRDGKVVAAAQLRILRLPVLPVGVAYARWAPLFHRKGGTPDPAVAGKMLECLRAEYCGRRGLVLEMIPHAYPDSGRGRVFQEAIQQTGFLPDPSLPCYRTILVDLTPDSGEMRRRLHQKWRYHLTGSENNGIELEVTDRMDAYREFAVIYQEMLDRKEFRTSVDAGEFGRMQEMLPPEQKMTIFLARKDGEVIGALVCTLFGDTAIFVLGATNEKARKLKASYLLHWHAMLWLKSRGALWYDLSGIDPVVNPHGHQFKRGFGGIDVTQIAPVYAAGGVASQLPFKAISMWRCSRR